MKLFNLFVLIIALYEVSAASNSNCANILVQVLETICTDGFSKIPAKESRKLKKLQNGRF